MSRVPLTEKVFIGDLRTGDVFVFNRNVHFVLKIAHQDLVAVWTLKDGVYRNTPNWKCNRSTLVDRVYSGY